MNCIYQGWQITTFRTVLELQCPSHEAPCWEQHTGRPLRRPPPHPHPQMKGVSGPWSRGASQVLPDENPAGTVTEDHTLRGLKQLKLILSQLWRPQVQNQQGCGPSKGSRGGSFLPLLAPGGSRRPRARGRITPIPALSSRGLLPCVCGLSSPFSYKDDCHWI